MGTEERLWQRIAAALDITEDGCWLWRGRLNRIGYGFCYADGRMQMAHRVVYERLVGPIPPELELDHLCRVRACVNPDHVEPVTHSENIRRAVPFSDWGGFQRAKTHCSKGHAFTPENTYLINGRWRQCRMCTKLRGYSRYQSHYKERPDAREHAA